MYLKYLDYITASQLNFVGNYAVVDIYILILIALYYSHLKCTHKGDS